MFGKGSRDIADKAAGQAKIFTLCRCRFGNKSFINGSWMIYPQLTFAGYSIPTEGKNFFHI